MSDVFKSPVDRAAGPALPGPEPVYLGVSDSAWARILILAVLLIAAFWESLFRLWLKTNPLSGDANWQHSFFVPLIGLYYLYLNREALLKAPVKTTWTGLPILLLGLAVYAYGIWPGQNGFVMDIGMVVAIFGLVTLVCGWAVMKIAWFPIVFLFCAIPWPQLLYSWVALPLQQLAAAAAVGTMRATGVEAWRTGTKLYIGGGLSPRVLNVAEACAGLKSLMTFVTVAAAMAFLSQRPFWQRSLITLSAIPIAIFCNMMRVAGQGLLDYYVDQRLSESFAHQFVGLVMLIPAVFLIQLVAWILDNLFIEEVDRRRLPEPGRAAASSAAQGSLIIEAPRAARAKPAAPAASTSPTDNLAAATQRLMAASSRPRRDPRNPSGPHTQEGR